jgi:hypothetical protein
LPPRSIGERGRGTRDGRPYPRNPLLSLSTSLLRMVLTAPPTIARAASPPFSHSTRTHSRQRSRAANEPATRHSTHDKNTTGLDTHVAAAPRSDTRYKPAIETGALLFNPGSGRDPDVTRVRRASGALSLPRSFCSPTRTHTSLSSSSRHISFLTITHFFISPSHTHKPPISLFFFFFSSPIFFVVAVVIVYTACRAFPNWLGSQSSLFITASPGVVCEHLLQAS